MKNLVTIFIVVCASFSMNAQIEFKTKISKDAVMIGEPVKVEYKVNQNFDEFTLTNNENFEIISGPNTSMQQSIKMSNGKTEKTIVVIYTYFMKAKISGKQVIPIAEIKIHGKLYYSESKDIIVIDSEYHNPNQNKGKDIKGTSKL